MRTTTLDPLAEKYYRISPYAWCGNNPVNRIDPDGKDYIITINRDKDGNITGITFSATIYITGDGANQKRADELNKLAKNVYKSQGVNGVTVGFDVQYKYSDKVNGIGDVGQQEGANVLYFEKKDGRSNVKPLDDDYAGSYGTIYNSTDNKRSNSEIMHETGHFLGFDDRYSVVSDEKGKPILVTYQKGYKNDLMGSNAPNLVKNHYQQMYNYVVTPERRENDNTIRMIYFPALAIKMLNRTENNRIVGEKSIDYGNK